MCRSSCVTGKSSCNAKSYSLTLNFTQRIYKWATLAFVCTKLLLQYQLDHTSHIYFGINSRRLAPSIGWSTTALHVGTPSSVTMRPARRWPPCCPGGEEGKGTGVGRGRTPQNLSPGSFCCARGARRAGKRTPTPTRVERTRRQGVGTWPHDVQNCPPPASGGSNAGATTCAGAAATVGPAGAIATCFACTAAFTWTLTDWLFCCLRRQ